MKFILFVAISIAFVTASPFYNEPIDASSVISLEGPSRSSRIVGGSEVKPHSIPWHVKLLAMLRPRNYLNCGGSIISQRTILTLYTCLFETSEVTVIAGAHNINTLEKSQQRQVIPSSNYRLHPSAIDKVGNIALIMTTNPWTINDYVQLVRLPTDFANQRFVGETATVSGWGHPFPNNLHAASAPIISNADCVRAFPEARSENFLCLSTAGGQGGCSGDSGGPVTVTRPGSLLPVQVAIFDSAYSRFDCVNGMPSLSTRVTSFLPWIKEQMRN